MRASFEAGLRNSVSRAMRIKLQQVIPDHWFSSAASECAAMYVAGFFYGAISIAQAYVDALSRYLLETRSLRVTKNPVRNWSKLQKEKIISKEVCSSAISIFEKRNDFHHLNKQVEKDYLKLETQALACVNHLHTIETEIFSFTYHQGAIIPKRLKDWPSNAKGTTTVSVRKLW
jgi:hypothetical protein